MLALADRVAVLDDGRLIALGPPAEIRHDPAVVAAYLGVAGPRRAEPRPRPRVVAEIMAVLGRLRRDEGLTILLVERNVHAAFSVAGSEETP